MTCAYCALVTCNVLGCDVMRCVVLQRDVVCDTMFSVVIYRFLSRMWYCLVRFANVSRSGE